MKSPAAVRPESICESSFLFLRIPFEGLERDVPETLQLQHLLDRFPHLPAAGRSELVNPFTPAFPRPDQTSPGQQSRMFADSRAAYRKPGGQFARAARRVSESAENLAASRVAESGDSSVQRHVENICNRLVTLLSIAALFERLGATHLRVRRPEENYIWLI